MFSVCPSSHQVLFNKKKVWDDTPMTPEQRAEYGRLVVSTCDHPAEKEKPFTS